jgi:hypothetical protein
MMNDIQITVEREADDDCYIYTVQATKMGRSFFATGYTEQTATARAIEKLKKFFCLN